MKRTRIDDLPPFSTAAPGGGDATPAVVNTGIWHRTDRPKIVGLVGWLMAGAGYLGLVIKGGTLPSYFMDMRWLDPQWRPMPFNRVQFAVTVSIVFVEMAVALLAIAGGLGTLKMREWGRRTAVAYALAAFALTCAKTAWTIWMFDFMLDYQASTTTRPFDRADSGNKQFFALIVSTLAQLLPCAIVASIMTRRYVRNAFDRAALATGAEEDGWRSSKLSDDD